MIFFNAQLMPDRESAILYMVANPIAFISFEDHQAGIYIQLHELIERAVQEGEDPILLVEEYLDTIYTGGRSPEELATFLMEQDVMVQALTTLQQHWRHLDTSLEAGSIEAGGMGKKEALQLYSEVTLRSYLETLGTINA